MDTNPMKWVRYGRATGVHGRRGLARAGGPSGRPARHVHRTQGPRERAQCLANEPDAVVVDLPGLVVGDELALTVFSALSRTAAQWPGLEVILCAARPEAVHRLERMAVLHHVPYCDTLDIALDRAAHPIAPRRLRLALSPVAESCPLARDLVVDACLRWDLPGELADAAELVVTELVANVVRYAGTPMTITVSLRDRFLGVAVRDGSSTPARLHGPDSPESLHGRGLLVVEALAAVWGSFPAPEGKVVWAALRLDR